MGTSVLGAMGAALVVAFGIACVLMFRHFLETNIGKCRIVSEHQHTVQMLDAEHQHDVQMLAAFS